MKNEREQIGVRYLLEETGSPLWAVALHDGHHLARPLQSLTHLTDAQRLREEDPFTGRLTAIGANKLVIKSSRFQLDLNRKIEDAIYQRPEQAWGLTVWKEPLPAWILQTLKEAYLHMQTLLAACIEETIRQHGHFIVLDIHSYNARRAGPQTIIDTQTHPQLNVGTIHNRNHWRPFIAEIIQHLQQQTIDHQLLDVRENVNFSGGYFSEWINRRYGESGCVLSLEFRKDFMDEWTGVPDRAKIEALRALLEDQVPFILSTLKKLR